MNSRAQELCRALQPVLGKRIDGLWSCYLAGDARERAELEQTLELLARKHPRQELRCRPSSLSATTCDVLDGW